MQRFSTPDDAPWWQRIFFQILSLPGGIAMIFALVLLAMLTGALPSPLSNIENQMSQIHAEHMTIEQKLQDLSDANNNNLQLQTRLLRGICIIMAKTQTDQLTYCNP